MTFRSKKKINFYQSRLEESPIKISGNEEFAENDLQTIIDNIIGVDYIIKVSGNSDLNSITHLTLKIDTNRQSIFDLCELLPNLESLVLDNSIISSIRDLGIGLRRLKAISLSNCGLNELDGIGVLTGLFELNISDNNISDVTPLAMHENLQVIYLILLF